MSVYDFSPEGKWTHFWPWNHANFTAEIFDWSGWQREQWVLEMVREKEKVTFASWGSSLTKFKGKVKDNIRFTKLPKIWLSCEFPQQWQSFTRHETGGCLKVLAETQVAENYCVFVTRCWILFYFFFQRSTFIATLYFLCTFPSFHAPFSLGFNDELKEAQGGPS